MKHKYLSIYYANYSEVLGLILSAVFQAYKGYGNIKSTLTPLCKPQRTMTPLYLLPKPAQRPWSSELPACESNGKSHLRRGLRPVSGCLSAVMLPGWDWSPSVQAPSFVSVLAAGSCLCLGAVPLAVPSRNRGGWMQYVLAGVWVTPWAPSAGIRLAQKGNRGKWSITNSKCPV